MHSLERLLVEIRQKPSLTFHVFYENCRPPKPEHVIQCLLILERSHLKASFETYVCNIIDIWIKVLPKEKLQMLKRVHKINKVKFKVNVQFLHFFGYLRRTINQQCAVPCHGSSSIYMSFDKFLLDVESRDLPQAGKKKLWVSSFSKLGLSSIQESSGLTWTFCKMNTLNPLKFTSHQKNWEKCLLFNQTVDSITPELKFCKIEKEHTLIILLSAWERSRDSTAKINLSKDM